MLVLVKYDDGTLQTIESTDVKEVSNPVRGVIIRLANSKDCIFVKAKDPEKVCLELHTVFVSNHLNLTNYGVATAEDSKIEEEKDIPKSALKYYFLGGIPYYILVAVVMFLIFSKSLVEASKAVADYTNKWMYPIFGDASCWVLLGAVCIFVIAMGYIIYRVHEKKQRVNPTEVE